MGATNTVNTATIGAFAADDVYAPQEALPARWQGNAVWAGALGTLNSLDQFETSNGAKQFPQLGEARLLRKPVAEMSHMSATVSTGEAILAYGDLGAG